MTAQTLIPQTPTVKVETKPPSSAALPKPPGQDSLARAYWGDLLTIGLWLFCFAVMAGMNLVEAVKRILFFLFGTPSPP